MPERSFQQAVGTKKRSRLMLVAVGALLLLVVIAGLRKQARETAPSENSFGLHSSAHPASREREDSATKSEKGYYYPSDGKRLAPDEIHGLLDQQDRLTDHASHFLGLDSDHRRQFDAMIRKKFDDEARKFSQRAVLVRSTGGNLGSGPCWEIHAVKDRGRSFWEGLYQDLPSIVSGSQAEKVVAAMDEDRFGGFGRFDGKIEILVWEGGTEIRVELFDPMTGSRVDEKYLKPDEFDHLYGLQFRKDHQGEAPP